MVHGVAVAILVTLAWVLVHVAIMHVRPAESRIRAMTLGYLVSLPFVYAACRWLPMPATIAERAAQESQLMGLFHAYFLHLLLYFAWVECFYHVERAVSLRFLIEILRHPDETAPIDEIRGKYNVREMVETRLEALRDHGFAEQRGDTWHLKPKGLLFARAMQFSAWIFQSKGQSERDG